MNKPIRAALLALCLLLSGCAAPAEPESNPALKNALGLTQEQRLEDYDYFVNTLKDSYLCLGLRDRENPDDPAEDIFREYRELIEESDSDQAFYSAVYSSLYRLGSYGHLWIIEPGDYYEMLDWCRTEDTTGRERWKELTEASEDQYARLKAYLDALGDEGVGSWSGGETGENLHTLLLPEEGIAYLKVDDFLADYDPDYQKEAQAIRDFYNAAGDCTDLIIDLTDNSGGNEGYWQNLLTAPLTDVPLSCTNYALLADSENNRPYIDNVFAPSDLHPISELPDLPKLERDGLEAATHFVESTLHVEPAAERAAFHGRVWLLVGPMVYSASESFSVFCQATGFATLVGQKTSGDGIGALDPVMMRLPNSGILIQYTMMYGLNPDGSSSEEAGTTPDVLSPAGEPALITALRTIRKNNRTA
ncbi:S41 family peptidase [uncultured Oscillibacter sp.]|uniref:S41 family peptidase n=1 Tax=uncultured Oscillibacter sp. TaxID=876091 RepID=UPI002622CE81|nr:S41 family peptidase [uncultured Oscillibacter sp.]